jgi:selenocysteine lyase/cysteine desulfurase
VGILYARPGLLARLRTDKLSVQDDAAPFRIETGTLNHAALAGVKAAIEYIASWGRGDSLREQVVTAMTDIAAYEHGIGAHYYEGLRQIPSVTAWGPDFAAPHRAPTVSITIDGVEPHEIARKLGAAGLQVWEGHFYAARAMEVLGLAERGGGVRTGICMYNLREEIDRLLEEIARIAG